MATTPVTLVGHARVCTHSQDTTTRHDALTSVGFGRIFTDTISSRAASRLGLIAALDHLRRPRR